jgi:hypothetical protein
MPFGTKAPNAPPLTIENMEGLTHDQYIQNMSRISFHS